MASNSDINSFSYSRRRSYRRNNVSQDDVGKSSRIRQARATLSGSPQSSFDKQRVLAKNGVRALSSMSDLLIVLAKSGISGPRDLKLYERSTLEIGRGSQFTVYKDHPSARPLRKQDYWSDLEGLVVKRVNVTSLRENGMDVVEGHNYRRHLMSLELEIVALCHPAISNHRNIARLISWGRDYLDPQTPLPVLLVEAAKCSLADFLDKETRWEIKHQLALDIASGLQVLHKYHIAHGDLKPENVLVFDQHHSEVPFVAKLSDFGLCIDLYNSKSELKIDDYLGTPDWSAPELLKRDQFEAITGRPFEATDVLKFDTYSYGLLLVSIFCERGRAPRRKIGEDSLLDVAINRVMERDRPSSLKFRLCSALRGLLAKTPAARPYPSPELLRTDDLKSYQNWLVENAPASATYFSDCEPGSSQTHYHEVQGQERATHYLIKGLPSGPS
jgi:serine/threonine protein kinase